MKKNELDALRKVAEKINEALTTKLKVCSKSCDQCLFTKNKIVTERRKEEILDDCERDQTHFICHKGSIIGENIVCNGFYRNRSTTYLELMKAAGRIEFVDPTKLSVNKERQEPRKKMNQGPKGGRRLK